MAVVKLEVSDSSGNSVFTTRRVKVTVKDSQGNLTMKQLDSTIKYSNLKGEIKEISNKCADIKVIPTNRILYVASSQMKPPSYKIYLINVFLFY